MSAELNPTIRTGSIDDGLKPVTDKKAPKTSVSVMNVALRILEGIGLIFANIFTIGLINLLPGIHKEYSKVFGGKEVEILSSEQEDMSSESSSSDEIYEIEEDDTGDRGGVRVDVEGKDVEGYEDHFDGDIGGDLPRQGIDLDENEDGHGCNDQVKKGFSKLGEGMAVAYKGANRENAQYAWNQTISGTSWALGNANTGFKAAWAGCTKENATLAKDFVVQKGGEVVEAAKKPENRTTVLGVAGSVGALALSTLSYMYFG